MKVLVTQSCPTLCDPVDCSLPGSFFHGILQARILVATFPSSGNLPDPGMEPGSPALQADSLPSEPPGKPQGCQGRPPLFHPLPAVSATTGHRKATDKGPARVPWSQQQNLLETACSVREEVVEHRPERGGISYQGHFQYQLPIRPAWSPGMGAATVGRNSGSAWDI